MAYPHIYTCVSWVKLSSRIKNLLKEGKNQNVCVFVCGGGKKNITNKEAQYPTKLKKEYVSLEQLRNLTDEID